MNKGKDEKRPNLRVIPKLKREKKPGSAAYQPHPKTPPPWQLSTLPATRCSCSTSIYPRFSAACSARREEEARGTLERPKENQSSICAHCHGHARMKMDSQFPFAVPRDSPKDTVADISELVFSIPHLIGSSMHMLRCRRKEDICAIGFLADRGQGRTMNIVVYVYLFVLRFWLLRDFYDWDLSKFPKSFQKLRRRDTKSHLHTAILVSMRVSVVTRMKSLSTE